MFNTHKPETEAEHAGAAKAAAEITAAGFTYEPVYTFVYAGKVYAFSYESAPNTSGAPAYEVVVYVA